MATDVSMWGDVVGTCGSSLLFFSEVRKGHKLKEKLRRNVGMLRRARCEMNI